MMSRGSRFAPVGFAEVPDFHVEVARRAAPELRKCSLLVGGDPAKRGKVVAASADLRMRGIVEGMGMGEALDRDDLEAGEGGADLLEATGALALDV